jgi:hypothetical protein
MIFYLYDYMLDSKISDETIENPPKRETTNLVYGKKLWYGHCLSGRGDEAVDGAGRSRGSHRGGGHDVEFVVRVCAEAEEVAGEATVCGAADVEWFAGPEELEVGEGVEEGCVVCGAAPVAEDIVFVEEFEVRSVVDGPADDGAADAVWLCRVLVFKDRVC